MLTVKNFIAKYESSIVFVLLVITSIIAATHYISNGQNLLYGDALSRMNISRKVFDNLTPGLAQLGNVWLPLPQILMLPFVLIKALWHTGIAGAIISMSAYIIGGIFVFKSIKILTNNFYPSIFGLAIFALNINMMYLQTTAMSESLFLCTLSSTIYFFLLWITSDRKMYLLPAAASVSLMTLTRYEGLAILLASIPMVFMVGIYLRKKLAVAEGQMFLYTFLAVTGFLGWTLYLFTIFGDPLYWIHFYAAPQVTVAVDHTSVVRHKNFLEASWIYFTSMVWMIGLVPVLLSISGLLYSTIITMKNRSVRLVPLFLPLSIFLFMILTIQRNTPIKQPLLTFSNLFANNTSQLQEFNIRYGLLLLPLVAVLCGLTFNVKSKVFKGIVLLLFCLQLFSYFRPSYSIIYQIPISISANNTLSSHKQEHMVVWLNKNYDHGLIMISALKHDPQMLQLGYDYKTYIHEGTGNYWKDSIKYPQRYATWVVFDSYNYEDQVTLYLNKSKYLTQFYNLVFKDDGMLIYKIKTKPELLPY